MLSQQKYRRWDGKTMKRHSKLAYISLLLTGLSSSTFAQTTSFSPYADLTINVTWDSHYQDMEPMDLNAVSQESGIKNYHLAFITDSGSCAPAWGGQSSYSVTDTWGKHLTDKLLANGVNYTISFGGANGNDISAACSKEQLVQTFESILNAYQPVGLDFDIENGSANVPKLMTALHDFQTKHPKTKLSFTLPVLPEGLIATGEDVVKQATANQLNYSINIMAMDYGPAYNDDMGKYSIQAATNLFKFLQQVNPGKTTTELWSMVEVTPMIGVNDTASEQFTLLDADMLRDFAAQNQLGGISMWSVARDKPCADKWASPICSGNNLQNQAYEFAQHFSGN